MTQFSEPDRIDPIQILSQLLKSIHQDSQIQFRLDAEHWEQTRAWLIAPEQIPHFPRHINAVNQRLSEIPTHSSEILGFFQNRNYDERTFWFSAANGSIESQLDLLLNLCALSVITAHLPSSDTTEKLLVIKNALIYFTLESPKSLRSFSDLAETLHNELFPQDSLHSFLHELSSAPALADIKSEGFLDSAISNIQELYKIEDTPWRAWLRETTASIKGFISSPMTLPQLAGVSSAFSSGELSKEDVWCSESGEAKLILILVDGKKLLRWSGPEALEGLMIEGHILSCEKTQQFEGQVVQFWMLDDTNCALSFQYNTQSYTFNIS
jgi:hypothetical protein